ncbi:MAG: alpha/beta hydrolase, partial [Gammaproteobacteria bacterium]|nr:alpha/beta hydrolase [Gammaproteobacteria bacterium]NIV20959.1 alpha/beta hydrolase [Gammaproteobacteria bacterium]NIY32608.1 alpha/beta hydrolase [Gammaproteobacteria bacterium]
VHLVGSSLGGWIALEMAVRNTSRLASLTLAAPAGIHVEGLQPGDLFLWSPEETLRRLFHDPKL